MLKRLFTEHPDSVDESYLEHMGVALTFSMRMAFGTVVCLVHAFLPFAFEKTGSRLVNELYERMVSSRHRHNAKNADVAPQQKLLRA